ncbi:S-Ena type endospore appendage [Priestia megaterium]|uniref:S-Ena type endospore appendage n=1 Tax=Priestia megaterium TaxID=1404 RepID=UPI0038790944
MGKRAKKVYKSKSYCVAHICPCPTPRPHIFDIIQNSLRGNILLNDSIKALEIWKEEICEKSTVTISVFNSSISNSFIKVIINRYIKCPVELTVPPGNTLSATVENAKSIMISKECPGILEGNYCLEVCFATSP